MSCAKGRYSHRLEAYGCESADFMLSFQNDKQYIKPEKCIIGVR